MHDQRHANIIKQSKEKTYEADLKRTVHCALLSKTITSEILTLQRYTENIQRESISILLLGIKCGYFIQSNVHNLITNFDRHYQYDGQLYNS